jgi:polar amino acid transport system permease protein
VLYSSAFMGEVIRSGIQAIPKTQYEAARSSGLSTFQVVVHVVMPQAVMIVIPPLATELVNLVKNSSLAMTIAVRELTFMTQEIDSITFRGFEAITAATLIYVLLCFSIIGTLNVFERTIKVEKKVI